MNTRGKRIAGWSTGIAMLILVGTGLVGRHTAWEHWYLYRLESPDEVERRAVAEQLLKMKSARSAPLILNRYATSNDFGEWIQHVVETLGPKARTAVPFLASTLEHTDGKVRVAAARALRHLGADAREAVSALIDALTHRDVEIRSCAAETLARIAGGATAAVPALTRSLNDPSWQVRDLAAMALVAVGPDAVPPLLEALVEEDGSVRDLLVVWTLGEIGPDARSATPLLEKVLRNEHAGLRRRAAQALGKIGAATSTGISLLQRALEDPDNHVRLAAVEALRKIERPARQRR